MSKSNGVPIQMPMPMPVPVPLPMPLPMLIPSVDSPSQSVGHFDFEFLINIIKGLENTIALLNRRLEAYENASANNINFLKANSHDQINVTKLWLKYDRKFLTTTNINI